MASLTRCRANPKTGVPNNLMKEYYAQRAGFGLIFTEASAVSPRGHAFPGAGNIYTPNQIEGWREITDAVHNKNGKILIQLFHCGRATHTDITGGFEILAPSPIAIKANIPFLNKPYPVPQEMKLDNISIAIDKFRVGAINAKKAGFDGVVLHAANGYLLDQFIRDGSNKRTDAFGGDAEGRCKFPLMVIDEVVKIFGNENVGIKISPLGRTKDMYDSNPLQTYSYLLQQLDKRKIAFVEIKRASQIDKDIDKELNRAPQLPNLLEALRPHFSGCIIGNQDYDNATGIEEIRKGNCDMISFGTLAISNPDLAQRLINSWELNKTVDQSTWYAGNEKGYTDYRFYDPTQYVKSSN